MFVDGYSLILRLDPNHVFEYVLDEETNSKNKTIFRVKPLSILQYSICKDVLLKKGDDGVSIGSYHFNVVKYGLVGWNNYMYIDNNEKIPFSFENLSTLPFSIIEEIARGILELSEVDEKVENQIRLAIQWSEYLSKSDNPDQWKCETCRGTKMPLARNCSGDALNSCIRCKKDIPEDVCPTCGKQAKPKFLLRLSKKLPKYSIPNVDWVTRCPSSMLDPKIISVINAISYMDDTKSLPAQEAAMGQSNYYYQVRQVMISQKNAALTYGINKTGGKSGMPPKIEKIDFTKGSRKLRR